MIAVPPLEQMTVGVEASLRDALAVIDANGQGVCFVVEGGRVVGVLTDGDARRALIRQQSVEDAVSSVMRRDFIWLPAGTLLAAIQSRLKQVTHIPILDADGTLVDYACELRYHQVPLTQPVLDGNELEYVTDCIRTGWISSQGKYVRRFEETFGEFVGNPNTLVVSNGTVALHLALVALGVGPGDEVLVPNLTFAAPANAVLYVGATLVLVDVDPVTMAIDVAAAERAVTDRTRAIIAVHLYGQPADMDGVMNLARRHNLLVIEDCAEALGSRYAGKHVGSWGDAATFSFFGNKTITTGEGGMIVFRDDAVLQQSRLLRDHGMSPRRRYWHDQVGFNYRMTNIQAAVGVAQMERVSEFVARKRWNAEQYRERLAGIQGLRLPGDFGDSINSYWLYTAILPEDIGAERDTILRRMTAAGVEVRPVFFPMHRMPPYKPYVREGQTFEVSDALSDRGISLPSAVTMDESGLEKVCDVMLRVIASSGRTSHPVTAMAE